MRDTNSIYGQNVVQILHGIVVTETAQNFGATEKLIPELSGSEITGLIGVGEINCRVLLLAEIVEFAPTEKLKCVQATEKLQSFFATEKLQNFVTTEKLQSICSNGKFAECCTATEKLQSVVTPRNGRIL